MSLKELPYERWSGSPFLEICWNEAHRIVRCNYLKAYTVSNARQELLNVLDVVLSKAATKVLHDLSQLTQMPIPETQPVMETEFYKFYRESIRYAAFVCQPGFADATVLDVIEKTKSYYQGKLFHDIPSAEAWLSSMSEV